MSTHKLALVTVGTTRFEELIRCLSARAARSSFAPTAQPRTRSQPLCCVPAHTCARTHAQGRGHG